MNGIKAIETRYNNLRFRSRIEARWAVFFDTLGVAYEYEKEGYELGEAGWYLPDFWLPQQNCWVEIKGDNLAVDEMGKQRMLASQGNCFVYLFEGQIPPETELPHYAGMFPSTDPERPSQRWRWQVCPVCGSASIECERHVQSPYHWHCDECDYGENRQDHIRRGESLGYVFCKGDWQASKPVRPDLAPELIAAYATARSARFEHGEKGRTV